MCDDDDRPEQEVPFIDNTLIRNRGCIKRRCSRIIKALSMWLSCLEQFSGGWNMRTASWSGIPSDQYVNLQTATTKREQSTIEHFTSIHTWEEEAQKSKNPLSFNKTLVLLSTVISADWCQNSPASILPLVFSVPPLRNAELDQRILFRSSVSLMASDEVADTWSGIHYLSDF